MDYKSTLNLPKTDFQMKADLNKKEPEMLKKWEDASLYKKIMETARDREKYTLHDGPPYANGNIHIGHALNKILKDIVVKSRFMMGSSTDFVPGWDCHGLPIELQVEKDLKGKKDILSKVEIRKKCREYANKYVSIQREEFKRLGVFGEWTMPYLTMNFSYQATILRELGRFNSKGLIYKGKKPVHWCASCKTALAEAEVEYAEKTSPSVYVKFEVKEDPSGVFKEFPSIRHYFIIWTTTPWTLPANLAIAVHPDISYSAIEVKPKDGKSNEIWIVHSELQVKINGLFGAEVERGAIGGVWKGKELEGIVCEHPFIERESKIVIGEHVTTDAGTGCVHIAPGHGADDYELGLKYGLDIYAPVDNKGRFTEEIAEFKGQFVFDANKGIIELLRQKEALVKEEAITHSYPHCWRCKNPIIFRATEQWFCSMEKNDLRKTALDAIDKKVKWIPAWGRDRIYNMIKGRPDWCLSRQRAWGVPIPALKCLNCMASFLDNRIIERLANIVEERGADAWFEMGVGAIVSPDIKCPHCDGKTFEKEEDILDVWFDSGVSFAAVMEKRSNLKSPASLYLEGSDQHRGWFQSSLIAAIGTRGAPPYEAALTHGFVVDSTGRKMSKSLGNVIAPQDVIKKYGVEVLRLWVAAEDYREDIRISNEILERMSEGYRRIRNTFRFILGNLYDFSPDKDSVGYDKLAELDRLTLSRLTGLTRRVLMAYENFEFHTIYHSVHNFCSVDLSAFYLDIVKDRLYTSKDNSVERRSAQTVLYNTLDYLIRLMAPVLVFTTDEAWQFMPDKKGAGDTRQEESVHLGKFPKPKEEWLAIELEGKWDVLLSVKSEISKALEAARKDKLIGHSLDASVSVEPPPSLKDLVKAEVVILKDVLIVSDFRVIDKLTVFSEAADIKGLKISIEKAEGEKCERCWHISKTVGRDKIHPQVCERCLKILT